MNRLTSIWSKSIPVVVIGFLLGTLVYTLPTSKLPIIRSTLVPAYNYCFRQSWRLFISAPDNYEIVCSYKDGSQIKLLHHLDQLGSRYAAEGRLALGVYNLAYCWDHYDNSDWQAEVEQFVTKYNSRFCPSKNLIKIELRKNGEFTHVIIK